MQTPTQGEESQQGPAAALIDGARERFRAFFVELEQRFVEREDAIEQVALALLARQHVLLTGPPGTAKSALCKCVLENIVDRATGAPSVFSRQLTESTVQTDLVGPLNFKTLMESGRSEHFTDEGMLGAVHAFLDEVLDGRDMLLRSTLNMLHERELKQGAKTTKGDIECALMTTNRYLSEVLEQSKETLLAFVDRIAFVVFVPKGFGRSENLVTILERQMEGRFGGPMPLLTIQDLDILQDVAESVQFPEHCNATLVDFLQRFERETAAATRADPSFMPTRYISTRTVVRTARLLRAICALDWIMSDNSRPLRVSYKDFQKLRLTLLLSGPTASDLPDLIDRETDPRERRQLTILQTERQVFDRVVAEMPVEPTEEGAEQEPSELPSLVGYHHKSVEEQIELCDVLVNGTRTGGTRGVEARTLLEEATAILVHRAVSSALQAGMKPHEGEFAVGNLSQLANKLDKAHPAARRLAPWVRTRALDVLEAHLELSPVDIGHATRQSLSDDWSLEQTEEHATDAVDRLYHRWRTRDALVAGGATPTDQSEPRWDRAVSDLERTLVQLWDEGLRQHLLRRQREGAVLGAELDSTLELLAKPLELMTTSGARLSWIGGRRSRVTQLVLGHRLLPILERAFTQNAPKSRMDVAHSVESLLQKLDNAGLHWAIAPESLIAWATQALLDAVEPESTTPAEYSYQGYRALRESQPKVALCYALVEVCTHIATRTTESRTLEDAGIQVVRDLLVTLDVATLERIVELDLQRINTAFNFVSTWWDQRQREAQDVPPKERLQHLHASRIHLLLEDESVLLRFSLEARLLGDLIPMASERCRALQEQLVQLNERVRADLRELWDMRSAGVWNEIAPQD